jgi:predicted nicotinamide N-methyase
VSAQAFIRRQTRLGTPSLVPELTLYLADEAVPLWQATEVELERQNVPPPYWAFAWPGGQALARMILDQPDLVEGKRVVDFGAGSGIASLAAAKAGAAAVLAADIDAYAAAVIALNAAANGVAVDVTTEDVSRTPFVGDVLLIGDMCYERSLAAAVLGWARPAARTGLVLLADPGRAYQPTDGLVEVARYTVPTSRDLEDRLERIVTIWRLLE